MSTATIEPRAEPKVSAPAFWTLAETAQYLRIHEATVRTWVRSGKIPGDAVRRPGMKLLFDPDKIRALAGA